MIKYISFFALLICSSLTGSAQRVTPTSEEIKSITPEWKGDRFLDGRPKVPDELLRRLKAVRLEEAWGILRNKGYHNQFEGDWTSYIQIL